jgi:hypothetical protein
MDKIGRLDRTRRPGARHQAPGVQILVMSSLHRKPLRLLRRFVGGDRLAPSDIDRFIDQKKRHRAGMAVQVPFAPCSDAVGKERN